MPGADPRWFPAGDAENSFGSNVEDAEQISTRVVELQTETIREITDQKRDHPN